ncbi:MAG: hypothetical protein ACRCY8_15935, partial [Dermatophilaceae bacterium]
MGDAIESAYRVLAINPGLVTDLAGKCAAVSSMVRALPVDGGRPTEEEWQGADADAARSALAARAAGVAGLAEGVGGVGDVLWQYPQVVVAAQQRARYAVELWELGQARTRWAQQSWALVTDPMSAAVVRDGAYQGMQEVAQANLEAVRSEQLVKAAAAEAAWAVELVTELLRRDAPAMPDALPSGWSELRDGLSRTWSGLPAPVRGLGNFAGGIGEGLWRGTVGSLSAMTAEALDFSDERRQLDQQLAAWSGGSAAEREAARDALLNAKAARWVDEKADQVSGAVRTVRDAVDPGLSGSERQSQARRAAVEAVTDGVGAVGRTAYKYSGAEDIVGGFHDSMTAENDQERQAGLNRTGQGWGQLASWFVPLGKGTTKASNRPFTVKRAGGKQPKVDDVLPTGGSPRSGRWDDPTVWSLEAMYNRPPSGGSGGGGGGGGGRGGGGGGGGRGGGRGGGHEGGGGGHGSGGGATPSSPDTWAIPQVGRAGSPSVVTQKTAVADNVYGGTSSKVSRVAVETPVVDEVSTIGTGRPTPMEPTRRVDLPDVNPQLSPPTHTVSPFRRGSSTTSLTPTDTVSPFRRGSSTRTPPSTDTPVGSPGASPTSPEPSGPVRQEPVERVSTDVGDTSSSEVSPLPMGTTGMSQHDASDSQSTTTSALAGDDELGSAPPGKSSLAVSPLSGADTASGTDTTTSPGDPRRRGVDGLAGVDGSGLDGLTGVGGPGSTREDQRTPQVTGGAPPVTSTTPSPGTTPVQVTDGQTGT